MCDLLSRNIDHEILFLLCKYLIEVDLHNLTIQMKLLRGKILLNINYFKVAQLSTQLCI